MAEEEISIDLAQALGGQEDSSTQNLTVYIPSADRHGNEIEDQRAWVRRVASLLARMGGGVTIMPPVEGGWLAPDGKIVWEYPILVYSYVHPDSFLQMLPELRALLHRMGTETNQGEIACQFDGIFYRITIYDAEVAT